MLSTSSSSTGGRGILVYYGAEAASAFAGAMYLYSVFFWARIEFGYDDTANLALGAVNGLAYVGFAALGGRMVSRVGCRIPVAVSFLCCGLAMVTLVWFRQQFIPFLVVGVATGFWALAWPGIESAIGHARTGSTMSERIGVFNLVWAIANPLGLATCALIVSWQVDAVLWVPGGMLILGGMAFLIATRGMPFAVPEQEGVGSPVAPRDIHPTCERRLFASLARSGNGVGYFMLSAFCALVPHVAARLSLDPARAILLLCVFMVARGVAFIVLFRWQKWHYRFGLASVAFWAAPMALAFMFFANSLWLVLGALFVFGLALGLTYSGSLYYSLDSGGGKHSGMHEAINGLGFLGGPLVGVAGGLLPGGVDSAKLAILGVAMAVSTVSFVPAIFRRPRLCKAGDSCRNHRRCGPILSPRI